VRRVLALIIGTCCAARAAEPAQDALAREVAGLGWIAFSAATGSGDWDLFVMRPDGSERRRLTDTREFSETGVRFSPDGRRMLYYRQPAKEPVDNNTYGTFELVVADAEGKSLESFGAGLSWATWSPDGRSVAVLKPSGIEVVDVATRRTLVRYERKGLVQQLAWSPDGARFTGTANGLGAYWNIGCLSAGSGELRALSETERYNCTPDWAPDGRSVLYARGIVPSEGGRAELWEAQADGSRRRMLYAEAGRHIYGACASPDGRYLLFTRSEEDLGRVDHRRTTLALIRVADAPMLGDDDHALRKRSPEAKRCVRLDLGPGWEPHWTAFNVGGTQ
jgi:Tol biopolymer transport system component